MVKVHFLKNETLHKQNKIKINYIYIYIYVLETARKIDTLNNMYARYDVHMKLLNDHHNKGSY